MVVHFMEGFREAISVIGSDSDADNVGIVSMTRKKMRGAGNADKKKTESKGLVCHLSLSRHDVWWRCKSFQIMIACAQFLIIWKMKFLLSILGSTRGT